MIRKGQKYTDGDSVQWKCTDVVKQGGKYYVTWTQVNDSTKKYEETYDSNWERCESAD